MGSSSGSPKRPHPDPMGSHDSTAMAERNRDEGRSCMDEAPGPSWELQSSPMLAIKLHKLE